MMSFWDGMKLWEKMLLVLAVAMCATLFFGIGRLIYNKSRIQRARKLEEIQKSQLETARNDRGMTQLEADDIPFGIRALEAGIIVKGVAITNTSTPRMSQITLVGAGSDRESVKSRMSLFDGHATSDGASSPTGPHMNIYQPSPYQMLPPSPRTMHLRSGSSSSGSSNASVHALPYPRTESPGGGRRLTSEHTQPNEGAAPWLAHPALRSSGGDISPTFTQAEQNALATLESTGSIRSRRKDDESSQFLHSPTQSPPGSPTSITPPDEFGYIIHSQSGEERYSGTLHRPVFPPTSYTPPFVGKLFMNVPETEHGDLSLLHSHRLSHAAEVGQLLPRKNRVLSEPALGQVDKPLAPDDVYSLDIRLPSPVLRPGIVHSAMSDSLLQTRRSSEPHTEADTPHSKFTEDLPPIPPKPVSRYSPPSSPTSDITILPPSESPLAEATPVEPSHKKDKRKLRKKRATASMKPLQVDLEAQ